MASRIDKGCDTRNIYDKDICEELVKLFAPRVHFDPEERFFPVDLSSAIEHSSLWEVDPGNSYNSQKSTMIRKAGNIEMQDLAKNSDYYSTVGGVGVKPKIIGDESFPMPFPRIGNVYKLYTDKKETGINAKLTIYATVCKANEVINSHLVDQNLCHFKDIKVANALAEGLIINYYMYFPAQESDEFDSEGDWSGISILLSHCPGRFHDGSLTSPEKLPVLTCYYRKTIADPFNIEIGTHNFIAGRDGFRRWVDVDREMEPSIKLKTHPIVYISKGRHNCYYEPTTTTIPLSQLWDLDNMPDSIEKGELRPDPFTGTVVQGHQDWGAIWPVYVACPPMLLFAMCASGCEFPVSFDGGGIPSGYEEGEDQVKEDGYSGSAKNTGSTYPAQIASDKPAASRQVDLQLIYVNLQDQNMAALWGFLGTWGGASLNKATPISNPSQTNEWGYYQGVRRPILSAWFLWNLFIDWNYGCGGTASLPEPATP